MLSSSLEELLVLGLELSPHVASSAAFILLRSLCRRRFFRPLVERCLSLLADGVRHLLM